MMMTTNRDNVLVKLEKYGADYIRLKTYSRKFGRNGWGFLINCEKIAKAINEGQDEYLERDGHDFLSMRKVDDLIWVATLYDAKGCDEEFTMRRIEFTIPETDLKMLLLGYESEICRLYKKPVAKSRIVLSDQVRANEFVDKLFKRAFCKCMRDSFYWGSDVEIGVYLDGWHDFYFTEHRMNGKGIVGGIVHHTTAIRGNDGKKHPRVIYSIHT